ncbi:nuclear transport factor 2 family protein [Fluviicola chungangensis]|uniref:Nuclear transport factor 2 family protein n=1 Tax=Fluviicola chungangensis TaxID=2597671 RepID=A0A556MYU1_9FLAO|nr:nuclear transport factor 2 family protein [Fluviicola chungangensis]TSJ45023.1 nuclear transport factor 2 family protein [Fluviicola chungangensis]
MAPKEVLEEWIRLFNQADGEKLAELYAEHAVNHQVANEPVAGKQAIKELFVREFETANMVCIPETIFEDGEWVILEWKDLKEMRGCDFFHIQNDKIVFQRGYWDKLSFHKLYNIPFEI